MARVKVCEVCGFSNDASELFCHPCGSSLALVPETDSKNSTPIPESPRLQAVPVELTEDPPICAEIAFPWGLVPISGRLAVGRNEAFSPIAKKLIVLQSTRCPAFMPRSSLKQVRCTFGI